MPSAVAKCTLTGAVGAADRVTVKVPCPGAAALPSEKLESPMLRLGSTSSMMVPVAVPWAMVAPFGDDRLRLSVSLGSTVVSPATWTWTTLEVSPAAKVRVPVDTA